MNLPFVDDPAGFVQCLDSPIFQTDTTAAPQKFYRYVRQLAP